MDASKPVVYHRPADGSSATTSLVVDLLTVFDAAGFPALIKPYDRVAIKLHCGEWNNTAYLRPVFARALADRIKDLGARPFVCDTITLSYDLYASRSCALDILATAERNGYTAATLGCPFVVADGYSGKDDVRVDLPEGFLLKEAFVANAIATADVLITLSHFKGHAMGMFGGAIKNLGIGAQSKRGKHNVHLGGHPLYGLGAATDFHPERCLGRRECPVWQLCEDCCPWGLFRVTEDSVHWQRERCTNCLCHLGVNTWCGVFDHPQINWKANNAAIADACLATVKAVGRHKVAFINMAIDIVSNCDCAGYGDTPVVPNLGIFASTDPVAVDAATKDKVTQATGIAGSAAEEFGVVGAGVPKLAAVAGRNQQVSEEIQLNTGVRIGLGRRDYQLVEVPPCSDRAPFAFRLDPRPVGRRFCQGEQSALGTFPYEREGGRGFQRLEAVDFALVEDE